MTKLGALIASELRFPRVGTIAPCPACGDPAYAQFRGVQDGKGQWALLDPSHTYERCYAMQLARLHKGRTT